MTRRDRWGWYPRAPKKPPPATGIKVKKPGSSWWGQRWIEALQVVLRGDSGRLARGRTYARAGRTHDLVVKDGRVTAKVTGSRSTPYKITIRLARIPDSAWEKAIAGMAAKAQFAADLLAGELPREIDEVFRGARTSLFPAKRADIETSCTCPDWGDPCKHVAASHYVLGDALDRDPFLLFELRGRTREQVLEALRSARSSGATKKARPATSKQPAAAEIEIPKVSIGRLTAATYDKPCGPLPALHLSFDEPPAEGALLRQLGAPPGWQGDASPADLLAPLVRAAAQRAREIALGEPETDARGSQPTRSATGPAAERRSKSARPGTPESRAVSKAPREKGEAKRRAGSAKRRGD